MKINPLWIVCVITRIIIIIFTRLFYNNYKNLISFILIDHPKIFNFLFDM